MGAHRTQCLHCFLFLVLGDAHPPCAAHDFRCANHQCVKADRVCNGVVDCGKLPNGNTDSSDEAACCEFLGRVEATAPASVV